MGEQNILFRIIEKKKARLRSAQNLRPLALLRREAEAVRAGAEPHALRRALEDKGRVNVIAEFKRASPSKGEIRGDVSAAEVARMYEAGGAAAISVLTEEDYFLGSLEDLREVVAASQLPALRKDFIVDEYQVYEAAGAGAAALLLIVAALSDEELSGLRHLAEEVLRAWTLCRGSHARRVAPRGCVGRKHHRVNNRDLKTFDVSLAPSETLAAHAPHGALLVSESGLRNASDIRRLRAHGFQAFLIGESLMRAERPEDALRDLIEGST